MVDSAKHGDLLYQCVNGEITTVKYLREDPPGHGATVRCAHLVVDPINNRQAYVNLACFHDSKLAAYETYLEELKSSAVEVGRQKERLAADEQRILGSISFISDRIEELRDEQARQEHWEQHQNQKG